MASYMNNTMIPFLALLLLFSSISAHSFMVDPEPYNQVFLTKSCEGEECLQACPNLKSSMPNSPTNPEVTWRRGETVNVKWAKNNHRGGLVYMSITPVDVMMSKRWQKRLAIWYGCWESGMYRCSGRLCGSDTDNEGFKRDVTIPKIYPDGIYVASIVWYGGLHFSRERGFFADYHSCSFVEIKGGPLESSYQPFWEPGDTGKFQNGDLCETAADDIEICPKTGCTGPSFWGVAKPFKNGNQPERITPDIIASAFDVKPEFSKPSKVDEKSGSTQAPTTTTQTPVSVPDPDEESGQGEQGTDSSGMVCAGKVCCPKSCGSCGGSGCQNRPGGAENCCYTIIKNSGRICSKDGPPCRME